MAGPYSYRKSKKLFKSHGLWPEEFQPRKKGGKRPKIRKNARVTMPLKTFKRAIAAARKGTRAVIKARVH
jgi:hypothetical protein